MNLDELIHDIFKANFTPLVPDIEERQIFTIITVYDGKELNISVPLSSSLLTEANKIAPENISDDNLTDWNPADDGWVPVETRSGIVYYLEEYDAQEVSNFLKHNKLYK